MAQLTMGKGAARSVLRRSNFGFSLWLASALTYTIFAVMYIIPPSSSKIQDMHTNILETDGDGGEAHAFVSRRLSIEGLQTDTPARGRRVPRAVEPRADGDGMDDATTSTGCLTNSDGRSCCMQYTWPGNEKTQNKPPEDPVSNISRTCSQIKEEDPAAACFDPIVYAYSNSSSRPDPTAIREYCINFSEACFCSSPTCIKYTIFNNDDKKTIVNETHFCGTVTQDSNKLLDSGCYKETRGGRIIEVCICKGDYCNGALRTTTPGWSTLTLTLMLGSIFTATVSRF